MDAKIAPQGVTIARDFTTLEDKPETQAKLKHEVDELRARVADLERKLAPGKV